MILRIKIQTEWLQKITHNKALWYQCVLLATLREQDNFRQDSIAKESKPRSQSLTREEENSRKESRGKELKPRSQSLMREEENVRQDRNAKESKLRLHSLTDVFSAALEAKRSNLAAIEEELKSAQMKNEELKARHEKQISILNCSGTNHFISCGEHCVSYLEQTGRGGVDTRLELLLASLARDLAR